jgi:hypothetical protein
MAIRVIQHGPLDFWTIDKSHMEFDAGVFDGRAPQLDAMDHEVCPGSPDPLEKTLHGRVIEALSIVMQAPEASAQMVGYALDKAQARSVLTDPAR